jgi:hypothetical protein
MCVFVCGWVCGGGGCVVVVMVGWWGGGGGDGWGGGGWGGLNSKQPCHPFTFETFCS